MEILPFTPQPTLPEFSPYYTLHMPQSSVTTSVRENWNTETRLITSSYNRNYAKVMTVLKLEDPAGFKVLLRLSP